MSNSAHHIYLFKNMPWSLTNIRRWIELSWCGCQNPPVRIFLAFPWAYDILGPKLLPGKRGPDRIIALGIQSPDQSAATLSGAVQPRPYRTRLRKQDDLASFGDLRKKRGRDKKCGYNPRTVGDLPTNQLAGPTHIAREKWRATNYRSPGRDNAHLQGIPFELFPLTHHSETWCAFSLRQRCSLRQT